MAETSSSAPRPFLARIDRVWASIAVIFGLIAVLDPEILRPTAIGALTSLSQTGIFIAVAVLAIAYLKATGAENLVARAFEGPKWRMILFGALLGGLSPFCSCEVIPFVAAMLALGAPLSAVMAFWLASPLMDPAMFLITSAALGWDFAAFKTLAAVGIGVLGGFATLAAARSVVFADPLRTRAGATCGSCCGDTGNSFGTRPVWAFWTQADRRATFRATTLENGLFLLKWLSLAYVMQGLMIAWLPAGWIAGALGGTGLQPILLGAALGAPAYLNGYVAVPLIDTLLGQGMSNGAAMSFVIAGGVSSVPAAIAVWALVKPRVFAAYLCFAFTGAVLAGIAWQAVA